MRYLIYEGEENWNDVSMMEQIKIARKACLLPSWHGTEKRFAAATISRVIPNGHNGRENYRTHREKITIWCDARLRSWRRFES